MTVVSVCVYSGLFHLRSLFVCFLTSISASRQVATRSLVDKQKGGTTCTIRPGRGHVSLGLYDWNLFAFLRRVSPRPRVDNRTFRSSVLTASEAVVAFPGMVQRGSLVTENGSSMPSFSLLRRTSVSFSLAPVNEASYTKSHVCCCNLSASNCRALTPSSTHQLSAFLTIPIEEHFQCVGSVEALASPLPLVCMQHCAWPTSSSPNRMTTSHQSQVHWVSRAPLRGTDPRMFFANSTASAAVAAGWVSAFKLEWETRCSWKDFSNPTLRRWLHDLQKPFLGTLITK